jgi:hypothetical protein
LVPDAVGPASDLTVPHEELLLRTVDDEASVGVGDETAAGKLRINAAFGCDEANQRFLNA